MYEDPPKDASQPAQRWWNRQAPPFVEALVYGLFGIPPIALLMLASLMPFEWGWYIGERLRAVEIVLGLIAIAVAVVYVWFFTPVLAVLARDKELRKRLGPVAYGVPVAAYLLLAAMAAEGSLGLTVAAVLGIWRSEFITMTVAPFVVAALLGVSWMPQFRAALPLWKARLGQTVGETDVVAPVGAETPQKRWVRDAAAGFLLLVLLCAPSLAGSTAFAIKEVRASGWTRQLGGGQMVRLSAGSTLEVPRGWSGFLSSASAGDQKVGVIQRLSADRPQNRFGFGFTLTVAAPGSVEATRRDASRMVARARKRGDSTVGPETVDYQGWHGTVGAIASSYRKQKDGSKAYYLAMQLEGKNGRRLCILVEDLPDGGLNPSRPGDTAKKFIDQVKLRK